jgi:hypothetical protein
VGADAVVGIDLDDEVLGSNNGMLNGERQRNAVTLAGVRSLPYKRTASRPRCPIRSGPSDASLGASRGPEVGLVSKSQSG